MNTGEWARIKGLFEAALLVPAAQRQEWLNAQCGDEDVELAEGYRKLGHVQGSSFSDNVGDRKGAIRSFEKAAALGEEVMRRQPHLLDAQMLLTGAYDDLTDA